MKTLLLLALLLTNACAASVEAEDQTDGPRVEAPEQFGACEVHVRRLHDNLNGCWRITSRHGFMDDRGFVCESEPSCEMIPGEDLDYVSGDVAWVGDVECSNSCK